MADGNLCSSSSLVVNITWQTTNIVVEDDIDSKLYHSIFTIFLWYYCCINTYLATTIYIFGHINIQTLDQWINSIGS